MNDKDFITTFMSEFDQRTLLYNEKLVFPASLRKTLPYVKAGLTVSNLSLLSILKRRGEKSVAEAASLMRYTPQYTSRIAAELSEKGFITRYKSDHNKSKTFMQIAPKGLQLLAEHYKIQCKNIEKRLVQALNEDERLNFLECVSNVNRILCTCLNGSGKQQNTLKKHDKCDRNYYKKVFDELNISTGYIEIISSTPKKRNLKYDLNNCIIHIYNSGQITISDLAKKTFMPLDAASKLVTKLVNDNIVERFQLPGDRRIYYVRVTETTRQALEDDDAQLAVFLTERFMNTSEEDKQAVIDSLKYINEILHRF